ncbi:hypothetical protein GWI33_003274 [Rhynchophorus ferrugineus]|uniref:Mos1 transposase HTH domain-containing protein n=1 Tax=Rhynchophorus ferrugineus TaxID=354439 RepID=A0A834MJ53_RHYFE|nr:hypothetical protein GWI33_003274 [Rhynchophorus ferrugineus]
MDKKKFCVLIKYCFLKGKNTVEAKTWLDAEFPDASDSGKSTIKDWCTKFRRFDLLPHPPYSLDLKPSDYFLFLDLKIKLAGKKCSSNEEVIAETEAYFETKDKSYP